MLNQMNETQIRPEPMPDVLLAGLFPGGIVVVEEEIKPAEKAKREPENAAPMAAALPELPPVPDIRQEPAGELIWLGNFSRQVLVVVKDPGSVHLNESDLDLLGKILSAVKLSIADIALVNAARHPLELTDLYEKLPARVGLYFGIEPVEIGAPIKFPHFQVQQWNNTTFVCAPSLSELNRDTAEAKSLKKELWSALQRVFS